MNLDWLNAQGLERLPEFLTALSIGLLIGLERERNPAAKAGLRTFALVAISGAAAAALAYEFEAPSIIGVGLAAVAIMVIAAYYHRVEEVHIDDPGTTTVVAVIACYLLAVMVMAGYTRLAVMIAIIVTTLLYFKAELGGVARRLERRDLVSILQFSVVTFVVLPLLPDEEFGPYAALNPRHIWSMVALISGVSLAGYVALRVVGREHGAIMLGLLGGLVSSTATTLAYSRYAKAEGKLTGLAVAVIVTANFVLPVRLTVFAAVLAPGTLAVLAPVLAMALIAGMAAYVAGRRPEAMSSELTMPNIRNPAELRTALGFAALYALVLLMSAWLSHSIGSVGVYAVALVSGLTDVDAITLSSLRLYGSDTLTSSQVAVSVVLALSANAAFKLGIVRVAGGRDLFMRCLPALAAMVAASAAGLAVFT